MRKIVVFPNPVLRKQAREIGRVDGELKKEVADLKRLLKESENGAALAAPQIGVSKRFFGRKDKKEMKVVLNPKIVRSFGKKEYPMIDKKDGSKEGFLEGCLSFPGYYGRVKRWLKIEAVWWEIVRGKLTEKSKVLEGFEAIVFQHERDHLDGVLFVDHIKKDKGKFFKWEGERMVKWKAGNIINQE